jgi:hypothetical protein
VNDNDRRGKMDYLKSFTTFFSFDIHKDKEHFNYTSDTRIKKPKRIEKVLVSLILISSAEINS